MSRGTTRNRRVKTATTIFEIVETLKDNRDSTLTELAERLGMPRSTLHPHLASLVDMGLVIKEDKCYRLSFRFLDYGKRVQEHDPLYQVGGEILEQVAERTNEIAWFVTEENGKAVCLRKAKGELAIQPYKKIGKRLTMHDIAAGKAILSELPDERVLEIIEDHGLPKRTDRTITDEAALFEELDTIRERGVAFNDRESMEGFRAVASPITPRDSVFGSIVVSGPKNRIRGDRFRNEFPEIVSGAANAIELELLAGLE